MSALSAACIEGESFPSSSLKATKCFAETLKHKSIYVKEKASELRDGHDIHVTESFEVFENIGMRSMQELFIRLGGLRWDSLCT